MTKAEMDQDLARLEEQIAALRADISRIAESLGHLGQTSGETLRATLAEKAEAHLAEAGQTAEAALADVTDYARRKPIHALALAGGLGLLFGLLFGRR